MTEVNFDVSKQFLDDRLSVSVGGSVKVEDESESNRKETNTLDGDVELEYTLTKDGRYRIKVFNKSDYENILDEQVRKTGAAIIYRRSFEEFRNLFSGREKGN
jgi:hypothetical protein